MQSSHAILCNYEMSFVELKTVIQRTIVSLCSLSHFCVGSVLFSNLAVVKLVPLVIKDYIIRYYEKALE